MQTIAPPGLYVWGNGLYPHATGGVMGSLAPSAYNTDMRSPYKRKKAPVVSSNPTGIIPRSRNEFAEHVIGHSEPPEVYNQGKPQLKQVIGPPPGRPPTVEDLLLDASEGKEPGPPKQMTLDDMIQLLKDSKNDDPEVIKLLDTLVAIKITSLSRTLTEFEQQYVDQARYELGKLAAEKAEETNNLALEPIAAKAKYAAMEENIIKQTEALDELAKKRKQLDESFKSGRSVNYAGYLAAVGRIREGDGSILKHNEPEYNRLKAILESRISREKAKIKEVTDAENILTKQIADSSISANLFAKKVSSLSKRAELPKVPNTIFNRRSAAPATIARSRRRSLSPGDGFGRGLALVPSRSPSPKPRAPAGDGGIRDLLNVLKTKRYAVGKTGGVRYSMNGLKDFAKSIGIPEENLVDRSNKTSNEFILNAIINYPDLMNYEREVNDFIYSHTTDFPSTR